MEKLQISPFAFHIVITFIGFSISETWIMFERNELLDGKLCENADILFSKIPIFDKSACLLNCANYSDCKSVFHTPYTGDCIGCSVTFDSFSYPTRLMEGSQYYQEKSDCPSGWSIFENSCYFISDEKMNFLDGLQKCRSLDASPVIIENENENNFIKELITSSMNQNDIAFFTGFTDIEVENTWVEYGTNNQMTFHDWAIGEPNLGTFENCLALFPLFGLKWVDISCTSTFKIICEIHK